MTNQALGWRPCAVWQVERGWGMKRWEWREENGGSEEPVYSPNIQYEYNPRALQHRLKYSAGSPEYCKVDQRSAVTSSRLWKTEEMCFKWPLQEILLKDPSLTYCYRHGGQLRPCCIQYFTTGLSEAESGLRVVVKQQLVHASVFCQTWLRSKTDTMEEEKTAAQLWKSFGTYTENGFTDSSVYKETIMEVCQNYKRDDIWKILNCVYFHFFF